MKRPHIAYLTFPHASHVNCGLTIVTTLAKRGYPVSYVTSERFAPKVSGLGVTVLTCPALPNYTIQPQMLGNPGEHPFIVLAKGTLLSVKQYFTENVPDVILYDDLCLAGRVIAKLLNVPSVQMSPCLALSRDGLTRQLTSAAHRSRVLAIEAEVARFLNEYGLPEEFFFYRDELTVYFYPRQFQLDDRVCAPGQFYAGRCAGEQTIRCLWRPKETNDRPVLLVTTSTFYLRGPDYFKMCINALQGLQWHVVLAIGDNNDPRMLEPLPPHFEILQGVPQFEVLRSVDMLIALGGMATTMEAMYYGIPLVLITDGQPEPELYADNVVRLGLGRHLRKAEVTVDSVHAAVVEVWGDKNLKRRVKEMQGIIQRAPGGEATANRIAEFLEDRVAARSSSEVRTRCG